MSLRNKYPRVRICNIQEMDMGLRSIVFDEVINAGIIIDGIVYIMRGE